MNTQLPGPRHARADVGRAHRGRSLLAAAAASLVALTGLSGIALASDEDETLTPSTSASSSQIGATEGAPSDETQPTGDAGTISSGTAGARSSGPEVSATVDDPVATADSESEATSPSMAPTSVQTRDVQIQPYVSATSTDIVVRKRTLAEPSSISNNQSSVLSNIGTNYAYTEGAVFRLYKDQSGAPGAATEYACTIIADGECTISVPETDRNSTNYNKRFWVVEEDPIIGTAAASTYRNGELYVGADDGPKELRRLVGLTRRMTPQATIYMPMVAAGQNGTVMTNDELPGSDSPTVARAASFGAVANSLKDPSVQAKCSSVKVAIILDESGSVGTTNWNNMTKAVAGVNTGSVMDVLQDKAAVSILSFSEKVRSRFPSTNAVSNPTQVTSSNRANILSSLSDYAKGGTNWDAALSAVQQSNTVFDLVLFVTDGAPNYFANALLPAGDSTSTGGKNVALRSLEAPIYAANAIKTKGTRIVAVGVGSGATGDEVGANLRAVSGQTANSDYVQGDWATINRMLTDVVKTAVCTVPIEVSKTTVDGSTITPNATGWSFAATKTGNSGTLGTPTPTNGTTGTSGAESVKWDLNFTSPSQSADVKLAETPQDGWALSDVVCTVAGATVATEISNNSVTIKNLGPASGKVSCTFTNAKVQVGALAITKQFDNSVPSGYGTSTVFNGSYTCTLGENTVASGTWTRTGTGTASLTPASGSPAATQIPVGATCSATETQPTGSGGLPNSSWEWDTYSVTPPTTIASNQTSRITVTNKAKRVYGNFQVEKVLDTGSKADASNTYSGRWSCTLGTGASAETKTGTWGPIAAGVTWRSLDSDQIPLGAICTVTSEIRPDWPVSNDHSNQWDGSPTFSTGVAAATANLGTVTVTNTTHRVLGSVTWQKVAAGSGDLLAGSTWTLTGPNVPEKTVVKDCAEATCSPGAYLDQDPAPGKFKLEDLAWGDYALIEKAAPAGYRPDGKNHTFTIGSANLGALGVVDLGKIENEQVTPPSLPLTGGLGTDTFLLAGGGLLALAGIGGWIHRRRSLRVQRA